MIFIIIVCRPVSQIEVSDGAATGVTFADGRQLRAKAVIVNADPFRLQQLVEPQHLPPELNAQLDSQKIDGSVLKVDLIQGGDLDLDVDVHFGLWQPSRFNVLASCLILRLAAIVGGLRCQTHPQQANAIR